ncbi:MAG TPA: hypothetical protein PK537_03740 [Candidatus Limiplasma sp.]|nr:hypothetical protein [Candidatus Limiplasma sp.]
MLNNASNKLAVWAKVVLFVGIALSIIAGFFIIWFGANAQIPATLHYTNYHTNTLYQINTTGSGSGLAIIAGFLVMIFGSLISWLVALLLRAFGDLASDTKAIREELEDVYYETETAEPVYSAPAEPVQAKAEAPKVEAPKAEEPAAPETPAEPESK